MHVFTASQASSRCDNVGSTVNGGEQVSSSENAPRAVGPWTVQSVNFHEGGRTSYRCSIGDLSADVTLLTAEVTDIPLITSSLERSKGIFALEVPSVLDYSISAEARWVASDCASGDRLSTILAQRDALHPDQWVNVARTALIGCAAFRSAGIRGFQLSLNTFVIDGDSVIMADAWASAFQRSDLYDVASPYLHDITSADDKYAIGQILTIAMGLDPSTDDFDLPTLVSRGYTHEHVAFVQQLTNARISQRPTTETALKSIPGGNPDAVLPLFALDHPDRYMRKRKARKAFAWIAAIALGIAAVAGGTFIVLDAGDEPPSSGSETAAPVPTSEAPLDREVRITLVNKEGPREIQIASEEFRFTWCYPEANMNMDEIPERLVFQQLDGEEWITDESVSIYLGSASKCAQEEVALSTTAPLPAITNLNLTWSPCQDFRILIPRISSDRRAPVRFCLQQRAADQSDNDA